MAGVVVPKAEAPLLQGSHPCSATPSRQTPASSTTALTVHGRTCAPRMFFEAGRPVGGRRPDDIEAARLVRSQARATVTRPASGLALSGLRAAVLPPAAGGAPAVPGLRRAAGAGGLADRARHAARRAETLESGATRLTVPSTHTAADGRRSYLHHTTVAWATATDSRIVRPLWRAQPAGGQHALCPSCGGTMPNGMLVTLNQMAPSFPAGSAYQAITAGDVGPLTPDLPIEPGELWCVVCLPCVEDSGLSAHLLTLVDQALPGN